MRMVSEMKKTWGGVFDDRTIMSIFKLMNNGTIKNLITMAKEGKEARVIVAEGKEGNVAMKVYAVDAANFKKMMPYLIGDPRFLKIKNDKMSIILAWAKKEYKNLERAKEAGVHCPRPLALEKNVLVMEFIGEGIDPAPRLTNCDLDDPEGVFKALLEDVEKLWTKAKIVHGDLSEFNILMFQETPWMIDFSQSVVQDHPESKVFLKRDLKNICSYFKKLGVVCDEEEIYERLIKK